jgi:putative alpha-1,2-mannosidase
MEAPYAYLFAGRHDKTCEIIRQIMKYMFAEGPGGLPGNNDSGALSAWYVWNALGLYPLSGQNKMLLGSPIVRHAEVALSSGHNLVINVHGCGMYTEKILLNGTIVKNMQIPVTTFMEGGTLEFYMRG